MEILKTLLSLFIGEKRLESFSPLIDLLSKNSFDLAKTLKNLNLDALAPIIKVFLENFNSNPAQNKTPAEYSAGEISHLNPIANIADKEIVYTLNKYFA